MSQNPPSSGASICAVCATPMHVTPGVEARGRGRFCSKACRGKAGAAARTRNAPASDALFQAKIKSDPSGCWLWTGFLSKLGYGELTRHGKKAAAHRVAYTIWIAEIPDGMHVLHKCDVPACCNPEHLFLGAHADNMRDMAQKGRAVSRGSFPDEHRNRNRNSGTGRYQ